MPRDLYFYLIGKVLPISIGLLLLVLQDGISLSNQDIGSLTFKSTGTTDRVLVNSFHVYSNIKHRYAKTVLICTVFNANKKGSEDVTFQMRIPPTAFISDFLIKVGDEVYQSLVREAEEAKRTFNEARVVQLDAGLVEFASNWHTFNISLNAEPMAQVTFNLTYEELLAKADGHYEHVISVGPEFETFPDYKIRVNVSDSQELANFKSPVIKEDNGNEVPIDGVKVHRPKPDSAVVEYKATATDKMKRKTHLSQFVISYELKKSGGDSGDLLFKDGYFVHFYTPSNFPVLRKHVVFLLDTSGSMDGDKMTQMKAVMDTLITELKPDDYFNIITFDTVAKPLSLTPEKVTTESVNVAKSKLKTLQSNGNTNIHSALVEGLSVSNKHNSRLNPKLEGSLPSNVHGIIILLTDGEPKDGITDVETILTETKQMNTGRISIYTIAFGAHAKFDFLNPLANQNSGTAKRIFDKGATDAYSQIHEFYTQISSPNLADVVLEYSGNHNSTVEQITRHKFPSVSGGSEIVVAGYLKPCALCPLPTELKIDGVAKGRDGEVLLQRDKDSYIVGQGGSSPSAKVDTDGNIAERILAYLMIQGYLRSQGTEIDEAWTALTPDLIEFSDFGQIVNDKFVPARVTPNSKEAAIRFALKYKFVTPFTSLVVVKPRAKRDTHQPDYPAETDIFKFSDEAMPVNQREEFLSADLSDGNTEIVRWVYLPDLEINEYKPSPTPQKLEIWQIILLALAPLVLLPAAIVIYRRRRHRIKKYAVAEAGRRSEPQVELQLL